VDWFFAYPADAVSTVTIEVAGIAGLTTAEDMEILGHMNTLNSNNWWWLSSQEMAAS
jgi:hypothetical protein